MYKVKILWPALKELERIADMHLAMVGPKSAQAVTDGILKSLEILKTYPGAYPIVPDAELAAQGFRMAIYKKYLSIYRIIDNTVYIYHIADGRTNYPQIIKGL